MARKNLTDTGEAEARTPIAAPVAPPKPKGGGDDFHAALPRSGPRHDFGVQPPPVKPKKFLDPFEIDLLVHSTKRRLKKDLLQGVEVWVKDQSRTSAEAIREIIRKCEKYFEKLNDDIDGGEFGEVTEKAREGANVHLLDLKTFLDVERNQISYIINRLDDNDRSSRIDAPPVVDRLRRLTEFAEKNDDAAVQRLAERLFPEWNIGSAEISSTASAAALPTVAPEIYQGLRGPETPPVFVQRVYGQWLGHGLTRAHIRHLDPVLSAAIHNWLKKPGCKWPADVDLPTLKDQNDRLVEQVRAGEPSPMTIKDARRIEGLIQTRRRTQAP